MPLGILIILVFIQCGVGAESFGSLTARYAPSFDGRPWPKFAVTAYLSTASNIWVHPQSFSRFPTIEERHEEDSDFTMIVLRLPDGSRFKTYNAFVLGPYLAEVYSGDFNQDGIPDFMAIKPGSGNGLAAEYCTGVFAFSEGKSYRFTRIRTMGLGSEDLVTDPTTKTFRLIHTTFRQGEGTDGRIHSFWVHRCYRWEHGGFQLDSTFAPVWIQYLNKKNHEPTKLLTPELKAKLLVEGRDCNIEW